MASMALSNASGGWEDARERTRSMLSWLTRSTLAPSRSTSASRWIESRSMSERSTTSRAKRVARVFCSFSRELSWERMCGGCVLAEGSAPSVSMSRVRSAASRSADDALDSSSAIEARSAAAPIASPMVRILPGSEMTSRRRIRAPSSRASRRASPTWDWAARAAYIARPGSMPSRRVSSPATASTGGVRSRTCRERERRVMMTSSSDGAQSIHTVRGVGSSRALSSASAARSVSRSASSMMMTRQGPTDGRSAASWTSARVSSTLIDRPSVATTVTSAWVPSRAVRHSRHSPQPSRGHSSAAPNARAATDLPDPGGPVKSHAWVIAAGTPTARIRVSTASGCPMTSSQTVTAGPRRR